MVAVGRTTAASIRRRIRLLLPVVLGLLGLSLPPLAFGWGAEGHRIVGLVADELLDAGTRARLRDLAGDESLADIGQWLDRERPRLRDELPGSERWHYDNRPVCRPAETAASYCAGGDCASAALARYRARLADHELPREERLLALRIVVHVLGDVHQPLHAADNGDRGGNQVAVQVGQRSRARPLHAAWDSDFVKRAVRGDSEAGFAHRLVLRHRDDRNVIESGDVASWMQESYEIAVADSYGRLPAFGCGVAPEGVIRLPVAYSERAAGIVAERLAFAGIRLAAVLRATL